VRGGDGDVTVLVHDAEPPAEHAVLFKWDTLRELEPHTLPYREPIAGKLFEVELARGSKVKVFRADDREFYFCHGLTFGGEGAPGGPVSPFSGKDVLTILDSHFRLIDPESNAVVGDILVWRGLADETPHSAILTDPVVVAGRNYLDYSSRLRSKNGALPEAILTLGRLAAGPGSYGESYNVFRRK
jgi:hypothetical protein